MEFYEAHKTFVTQTGMDHEKNIDKLRILTLMSLAENNKELPFDTLQKQLKIEADEIESFVIDGKQKNLILKAFSHLLVNPSIFAAIRTKCIRCKIDHLAKTVTIMSVSYRTFTKQHWQVLKERLEKWKENLTLVNQNLTNLLSSPAMLQM